ncbi:MAG: phosphoenolpyruvate carboxykinase, partial [Pseudomonadota bacterium]
TKEINAIFWLMKDPCIPPIVKINDPVLASTLGATLATKRTSAERLAKGVDPNALVFEPYANPFRTYPLSNDYLKFKSLFERGVDCYILNTGHFMDVKVQASDTLSLIEALAEKKKDIFKPLFGSSKIEYATTSVVPLPEEKSWQHNFISQLDKRVVYINSLNARNKLPDETKDSIHKLISEIKAV